MTSGRGFLRSFLRSILTFVLFLIVANWSSGSGESRSSEAQPSPRGEAAPGSLRRLGLDDSLRGALTVAHPVAGRASEGVPLNPSQEAYLKASNTGMDDSFGWSIAISGETVVVGAVNEASNATGVNGDGGSNSAAFSGAAYVFVRTAGVWSQQAYLKASNTGAGDSFGHSVAVSGDTIVVGAPYEDSSATGVNGNGANNASPDSGAAYVFVRTAGVWSQQAYLKASNTGTGDRFGYSVSISSETVLVGADGEDSSATGVNGVGTNNTAGDSGAGYVFLGTAGVWSQQAYLKASNTASSDAFGWSLAVSGETAVVGAPFEDSAAIGVNGDQTSNAAESAGAAYVFVRSGTTWSQQAYLKAANTEASDFFGYSIAISAETIVVGSVNEDSAATGVNGNSGDNAAPDSGAAFVFARTAGVWNQQAYLKASNTGENDFFGNAVGVSGDMIVVGAPYEFSAATGVGGNGSNNSAPDAGAAYQFQRTGTVWSQRAYLKPSNTEEGDRFGYSVAVSTTVVVGAVGEDSAASGINGNPSDNSTPDSGAAYVFTEGGQQGLSFSIAGSTMTAGSNGSVSVVFFARGDENSFAMSLSFDPTRLSYISTVIAAGLPPGSNLIVDPSQTGSGRVGARVSLPPGQALTPGAHPLLTLTLNALSNAAIGQTQINFGDVPVERAVVRPDTGVIPIGLISFNPGFVNIIAPIPVRNVRALGSSIQVGSTGSVAVEIDAVGTENGLAFSLTFESTKLTFVSANLGSGAPGASLNVNHSEAASGRIGIAVDLPAGQALQSGTRQAVNVVLNAAQGATAGPSQVGFGDSPVPRELVDTTGAALPTNFINGMVTIEVGGFEGDTSPRPNGNGLVSLIDWVQTGRFAVGLDTAASGGEFQRADCAPRETKGNGLLSLADWVQAGRYGAGLDPVLSAGGPTSPTPLTAAGATHLAGVGSSRGRELSASRSVAVIVSSPSRRGFVDIAVWIDAGGMENAISFGLSLEPDEWEFVSAQPGRDATNGTLIVNSSVRGRLGVALAMPPGQSALAGWRTLVEIRLERRGRVAQRVPVVRLVDDESVGREVVDVFGNSVVASWLVYRR